METRLNHTKASPESYKALLALETFVQNSGLERASFTSSTARIHHQCCAYCVDMHVKESRHVGFRRNGST